MASESVLPGSRATLGSSALADLKMLARWVSLGACAGGLGGFVVGGIGGRLAMLLLRFTSPDFIRGLESDDGFIMGRFDLGSTIGLLAITTILGSIGGLIVVFGRPFFPKRFAYIAWPIAGGAIAGAEIVKSDGVDFTLLEPRELSIAMFVAIPALGALLIVRLIESWELWWWHNLRRTLAAAVLGLPSLVFFPLGLFTAGVAAAWFLAMRIDRLRTLPRLLPIRVLAVAVFGILTGLGLLALAQDVADVL